MNGDGIRENIEQKRSANVWGHRRFGKTRKGNGRAETRQGKPSAGVSS